MGESSGMASLIGQTLGQYKITGILGEGGMATVYRAIQTSIDREVAIKVIETDLANSDEYVTRFKNEAKTIARLSHAHILKVFDYGQFGATFYLVMELLGGGTLSDIINKGPMLVADAIELLGLIAGALDFAHKQGVIHRDLKPGNILLDQNGSPFLTDFGIAKIADDLNLTQGVHTQTGVILGTPMYMSPEQWQSKPLDSRSDLYSFGIIAYQMLVGEAPYRADTPFGLMHKHLYTAFDPASIQRPDVTPLADAVLRKATAKFPQNRFQTAIEFVQALKIALEGGMLPGIREDWREGGIEGPAVDYDTGRIINIPTPATTPLMKPPSKPMSEADMRQPTAQINVAGERTPTGALPETPLAPTTPHPAAPTASPLPLILGGGVVVALLLAVILIVPRLASSPAPTLTPTIAVTQTPAATAIPLTPTPLPFKAGDIRKDTMGMAQVFVPAGCFTMGSEATDPDSRPDEYPARQVCLTQGFWLDQDEVTNESYQVFINADGYNRREFWSPDGWDWKIQNSITGPDTAINFDAPTQPRVGVSRHEADAYAKWRSGRLPTEAEWEYAARGSATTNRFPWGEKYIEGYANVLDSARTVNRTQPVGNYPRNLSWVGARDMAGNAVEWVIDRYSADYYKSAPSSDPINITGQSSGVVRGGSYVDLPAVSRTTSRNQRALGTRFRNLGFRIVTMP
jgi:serine/threonine-protein kinase